MIVTAIWIIVFIGVGIGLVLLFFRFMTFYTKRANRMTSEEVAAIIEKHLNGTEGPWDWDDFTSCPINDDRLDKIRSRCIELDHVPFFDRNPELKRIIEELRAK